MPMTSTVFTRFCVLMCFVMQNYVLFAIWSINFSCTKRHPFFLILRSELQWGLAIVIATKIFVIARYNICVRCSFYTSTPYILDLFFFSFRYELYFFPVNACMIVLVSALRVCVCFAVTVEWLFQYFTPHIVRYYRYLKAS